MMFRGRVWFPRASAVTACHSKAKRNGRPRSHVAVDCIAGARFSGTRTYRMSVRAAATQATRERIVEAAAEAFHANWYEDVTMRDVASAAGVALQTVVNHFATKEALFAAATSARQPPSTRRHGACSPSVRSRRSSTTTSAPVK